jgi:hypothetical protein
LAALNTYRQVPFVLLKQVAWKQGTNSGIEEGISNGRGIVSVFVFKCVRVAVRRL